MYKFEMHRKEIGTIVETYKSIGFDILGAFFFFFPGILH